MALNYKQIAGLGKAVVDASESAVASQSFLVTVETLHNNATLLDQDNNDGLNALNAGIQAAFAGTLTDEDYTALIDNDAANKAKLESLKQGIVSALAPTA